MIKPYHFLRAFTFLNHESSLRVPKLQKVLELLVGQLRLAKVVEVKLFVVFKYQFLLQQMIPKWAQQREKNKKTTKHNLYI